MDMVQFLVQNIESHVGNKTLQQWKDAVTPNFFVNLGHHPAVADEHARC